MERLASGCSAIQGTACNKRVRFLVPSSALSLRLPAPCILSTLPLFLALLFSLSVTDLSFLLLLLLLLLFLLALGDTQRRDHRVIFVYLAHIGRAHNTALPLGCTHSQAVYTHTHERDT